MDWVLPGILSIIVGKHQAEVRRLFERVNGWKVWTQLHLDALVKHDLLVVARNMRKRFLIAQAVLVALATVFTVKATGFCGPVDLPYWLRALPLIALSWIAVGAYRVYEDRAVRSLPGHAVDGRSSTRIRFSNFTDEQKADEYGAHGIPFRKNAATRADPNLSVDQQNDEIATRSRLRKEFGDAGPFAPRLNATEMDDLLLAHGGFRAQKTSPFPHMTALIRESLLTAFAIFGSAVALGSYSYSMHGVNLVFPMLLGLVAYAALMVAYAGWIISVRAPLTVADGVAQATKRPITGIFHLLLQISPKITAETVKAQFGDFEGELISKSAEFVAKWENKPFAALLVLFVFGLFIPHWWTLLIAIVFAAAAAAMHTNLETVGVETLARRRVAAERLDRAVIIGLVLQFVVLGIALFAREWFGNAVASILSVVNDILHFGYRESYVAPTSGDKWDKAWDKASHYTWSGVRVIFMGIVVWLLASWASSKTTGPWTRRIVGTMAALGLLFLANQIFEIPNIAAAQIGRRASFACSEPPPAPPTMVVRRQDPSPVVAPPPVVPTPQVVYAPSSLAALPIRLPGPRATRRASRHRDTVYVANVERDCVPLADVVRCSELNASVREDIRASCGCQ